jgi:hypothetical protein
MTGLGYKARELGIRDRLHFDVKLVNPNATGRPFVVIVLVRTHQQLAAGNPNQFRHPLEPSPVTRG